VADHEHGEALIVRLDVSVVAVDHASEVIETGNRGVFVENDVHLPMLEQQIAEMAKENVPATTARLKERGHDLGFAELAEMYVDVELDPQLRAALSSDGAVRRSTPGGSPSATARLSERTDP
jgi:hypothetical protein